MAFIRHSGRTKLINVPVTVSTSASPGGIMAILGGVGTVSPAGAASTPGILIGVIRKALTSTDADFATARSVLLEVPLDKNVEWEADTTGAVAADVGKEVDLTDYLTINRGASSVNVAQIRQVLSATKVTVVLKLSGSY